MICGPALGGLVYIAGAGAVYVCCAMLLATACALTLGVRYTAPPPGEREGWRGMFRGVGFIWGRKVLLGRGLPPIYDRAALKLSAEEKAASAALLEEEISFMRDPTQETASSAAGPAGPEHGHSARPPGC